MSFQLSDSYSLGRFCVIPGVLLLFTSMCLSYCRCPSAAYSCGSLSFCFPLLLTGVALCFPRCFATTPWGRCESFQLYHCFSLGWICIIPIVPLSLTGVAPFYFSVPVVLIKMILHDIRCLTAAHCCRAESFQASHQCLLRCLCQVSNVPLPICRVNPCHSKCPMPLSDVALCCTTCPTAAQWGGSMSLQVSLCHLLSWLHVILCFFVV